MKKVKLKSVSNSTSQGISFKFEGLPAFNEQWFSWEYIASKLLGIEVEAELFKAVDSSTQDKNDSKD